MQAVLTSGDPSSRDSGTGKGKGKGGAVAGGNAGKGKGMGKGMGKGTGKGAAAAPGGRGKGGRGVAFSTNSYGTVSNPYKGAGGKGASGKGKGRGRGYEQRAEHPQRAHVVAEQQWVDGFQLTLPVLKVTPHRDANEILKKICDDRHGRSYVMCKWSEPYFEIKMTDGRFNETQMRHILTDLNEKSIDTNIDIAGIDFTNAAGTTNCIIAKTDSLEGTYTGMDDASHFYTIGEMVILYSEDDDEDATKTIAKTLNNMAGMKWMPYIDRSETPWTQYKCWMLSPHKFGTNLDETADWLMHFMVTECGWNPSLEDWRAANVHNAGGSGGAHAEQ